MIGWLLVTQLQRPPCTCQLDKKLLEAYLGRVSCHMALLKYYLASRKGGNGREAPSISCSYGAERAYVLTARAARALQIVPSLMFIAGAGMNVKPQGANIAPALISISPIRSQVGAAGFEAAPVRVAVGLAGPTGQAASTLPVTLP